MTSAGYQRLTQELKHLKTVERPAIIVAIATARERGDLSENAEYHSAREKQGFIEGRIVDLESKISHAEVIDVSKLSGDTLKFGATVTILDEDTDQESSYQIVGQDEADVSQGLLSISSPLARALIARKVGDSVDVTTPNGLRSYEVLKIKYL